MKLDKPNILLCVMDDHQFDALGVCGHPVAETPNLDALAKRGVRFANARMPGGTSAAVCMPSRAMLHTGRSLFRIEGAGERIPAEQRTLGECLREAGYAGYHTGKWHNDMNSLVRSFDCADEFFFGGMSDPWNTPLYHYNPEGIYDNLLPRIGTPVRDNEVVWHPGDHVYAGRHCTDIFCDRAARFIVEHDGNRPFFLSLALMAPHDPRTAPKVDHARFHAGDMPLPENFMAEPPSDTGCLNVRDECLASKPRLPEEVRRHIADYFAMIRHLDAGLGRVFAALEESGHNENTVVVFVSDHGLELGRHGLMGKQCVYEHSIRVPLILAGAGLPMGAARKDPVLHYDLFRTLGRLAGADLPKDIQSVDLEPEILTRMTNEPEAATRRYFAFGDTIRAIISGHLKLIEYAHGDYRKTELFDLAEDPGETENLVGQPERRAEIDALRAEMLAAAELSGDIEHNQGREFWKRCNF